MQSEWLAHQLGTLQATVSTGFQEVHRRIDDQRRFAMERHRAIMIEIHHLHKTKRETNGHGDIPYIKYALLTMAFLIVGTLGHLAPGALRSAILDLVNKLLAAHISGGP